MGIVVVLGGGISVLAGAERALMHFPDLLPTKRDLVRKEAGLYLESHAPGPKKILDTGTAVSYYSGGTWLPMPWAAGALLLKYIARVNPDFVVVNVDVWNTGAIELKDLLEQEPRAHFVKEFSWDSNDKLRLYKWSHECLDQPRNDCGCG